MGELRYKCLDEKCQFRANNPVAVKEHVSKEHRALLVKMLLRSYEIRKVD